MTLMFLNGATTKIHDLIIENCIRDAIKVEYHYALIELYNLKKQRSLFNGNAKEYGFCKQQIIYYKKCYAIHEKVLHHYNEIVKDQGYGNSESPNKVIKHLKSVLDELNKEKKYLASVYSKYMFSMIQLEYMYRQENFIGAKKMLRQLYRAIGASPLNSHNFHVIPRVENELGICALSLGDYEQAIRHLEKALMLLWKSSKMNYYISLQELFHAVFHNGNLLRAEKILAECISDQHSNLSDFRITKLHYFQACLYFKKKEYKQALKIVAKPMSLNKDKTGYDIAIRILRIQCLIELSRLDEASAHIENLRKHVSRNYKKTFTSERDTLITRLLVLMYKNGFSGLQNKTESQIIKKLSDSHMKYKWLARSPELIKFHEWYIEIVNK